MNKQSFLAQLRKGLSGLPKRDIDERLTFYSDMIDDRIEDGIPEETAVHEIGSMDALIAQIKQEASPAKSGKKRKLWKIVLLVLGSPIWLSLLIAAFAVMLALFAVLWAVFASFVVCGMGGTVAGALFAAGGDVLPGIAMIGAGSVCAGLSIFLFFGCKAAAKGMFMLTKKLTMYIKTCFMTKEEG